MMTDKDEENFKKLICAIFVTKNTPKKILESEIIAILLEIFEDLLTKIVI